MPFKLQSQPGKRCLAVGVLDDRGGFQLKIVRIQNLVFNHQNFSNAGEKVIGYWL